MKTSRNGIELIKSLEGCVLTAYWDIIAYSIGYGHLGAKEGQTITKQQAEELLISDLPSYEEKVEKYNNIYHWTQNEFDALVSYCYNTGGIKKLVDNGSRTREEIIFDWITHDMAGGKHLQSLRLRRLTEISMFRGTNMTEKNITICGHGSDKPSLKNMFTYLDDRYNKKAPNGKHKGVIKVMRLKAMTDEGRAKFVKYFDTILGRNFYSQDRREYCYVKFTDGKYYSDCSSVGIKTYEKCGYQFPRTLNTAGIYESDLFEEVPVDIVYGHILNPEVLKIGDALLFVGDDPKRPLQIGHVEYVYKMPTTGVKYPCWVKVEAGPDTKWYYRLKEGVNAHGWMDINHHRYYFDPKTGEMTKEWKQIDGKWYYFQPESGKAASLAGALYISDADGAQRIMEV